MEESYFWAMLKTYKNQPENSTQEKPPIIKYFSGDSFLIVFGLFWYSVRIVFRGSFLIVLGLFWGGFGVVLGLFWGSFGVVLA